MLALAACGGGGTDGGDSGSDRRTPEATESPAQGTGSAPSARATEEPAQGQQPGGQNDEKSMSAEVPPCPALDIPAAQTSAETDRDALIAFFEATDGESWDESGTWAGFKPIGEWPGVTTDEDGRVVGLEIQSFNGEIPAELGNLPNLELLGLGDNQSRGEIPAELGNLTNLRILYLGYNQFSGEIPAEFDKLWDYLKLNGNQLTGCVSDFLVEQANEEWEERGNYIGVEYQHVSLPALPVCDASDPEDLERLIALYETFGIQEWMYGWEGWLGCEPIGQWENVTTDRKGRVIALQVSSHPGNWPEIGSLANLRYLITPAGWGGCHSIPPVLSNLVNLQVLAIYGGCLQGEILAELGNLTNLELLVISENQLSGEIPAELGNLTNLGSPEPRIQPVERGDTGGTGQPLQSGEFVLQSLRQPVDWLRPKGPVWPHWQRIH